MWFSFNGRAPSNYRHVYVRQRCRWWSIRHSRVFTSASTKYCPKCVVCDAKSFIAQSPPLLCCAQNHLISNKCLDFLCMQHNFVWCILRRERFNRRVKLISRRTNICLRLILLEHWVCVCVLWLHCIWQIRLPCCTHFSSWWGQFVCKWRE